MTGKYLFDSNIVIDLLMEREFATTRIHATDEVFLSVIAYGELLFGVENSARVEPNRSRLDNLVQNWQLVPCTTNTAVFYASIRMQLKRTGRPIPEHDIWIAATAIQHDLTLVSRDSHFAHIGSLRLEHWT